MAKASKRWAVRERQGGLMGRMYRLSSGVTPRKGKDGDWLKVPRGFWLSYQHFETFFSKCYHLKPGGGPVEIKFEE